LDPETGAIIKELGLLEVRMKLHFVKLGLNATVSQNQVQFRFSHIACADVTDQPCIDQSFHLSPNLHVLLVDVRTRFRVARIRTNSGIVVVWKRPMDEKEVQVVRAKITQALGE
jgi:hypothetical protein